ncbi:MAG TPA: helix-turn-helix transcriptional regulator, partial [Salinimicrobium sp.]|nr:helix-turn-helix transcriptional regulator [Salinimicrobium sp.]
LFGKSYNHIALNAEVRKATVSDTFNGKSIPKTATLILMVEAMGYKLSDFAKEYDSISESSIKEF